MTKESSVEIYSGRCVIMDNDGRNAGASNGRDVDRSASNYDGPR